MSDAEKLAAWIAEAQANVRRVGEKFTEPDDDWISVAFLEHDGSVSIVGLHGEVFSSHYSKDRLAEWLRDAMNNLQAERYAVLFNTHGLSNPSAEDWKEYHNGKRISEFPNAYEMLMLIAGDAEQEIGYVAKIVRDGVNPPTLEAWEQMPKVEGRFANLNERMAALT